MNNAVGTLLRVLRLAPVLLAFWIAAAAAAEPSVFKLSVDGLACPFCAYGIEKSLSRVEGVSGTRIDIHTGTVTVTMSDGAALTEEVARAAVKAAGFTLGAFEPARPTE